MFDFRKIEAFCKVYELKSFSRAGDALFLSQPTVSAHIQALERELEVQLLDRMGRTVLPTPAGTVLYRYAKEVFSHLETAKAEINALASEVTGDLILGSSTIPAYHVLPHILADFSREHPKVRPSLTVASSAIIAKLVLDGEIMAGIVGTNTLPDPELVSVPLLDDPIVVIAPAAMDGLPAAGAGIPEISFKKASALHWIIRDNNSATRREFETALRNAGHDPRSLKPRLVVDSAHAAVQYVAAGLGVSIATRIAVKDALERGEIRAFSITNVHAVRQFSCITNARRVTFPVAAAFLEYLKSKTQYLRTL